jgi:hypothetical protein
MGSIPVEEAKFVSTVRHQGGFVFREPVAKRTSKHQTTKARPVSRAFFSIRVSPSIPVPVVQSPVVAFAFPLMRYPVVSATRRLPVTFDPTMAASLPVPEARNPDIANGWRRSDVFRTGRRRSNHDRFAVIGPFSRYNHATGQQHRRRDGNNHKCSVFS